jgi:hypothetical protein
MYSLPVFDKPQSRVSDVATANGALQLQVALDDSKRKHTINSWVEDMDQKVIKKIKTQVTQNDHTGLRWKPRISQKKRAAHPRFVWHTEIDGVRHARIVTV